MNGIIRICRSRHFIIHEMPGQSLFCNKCGTKVETGDVVTVTQREDNQISESNVEAEQILHKPNKSKKKPFILMFEESGKTEVIVNMYLKVWLGVIDSKHGIFIKINDDEDGGVSFTKRSLGESYSGIINYASDFNRALEFVNQRVKAKIALITSSQSIVDEKMKLLNNPPEEYKTAYEIAFDMFGNYNQYVSLAESPSGSLVSYKQLANDLASQIIKEQKDFEIRLPKN